MFTSHGGKGPTRVDALVTQGGCPLLRSGAIYVVEGWMGRG
jgi:hypothetical protein